MGEHVHDLVVLGAGPAGIGAAHRAARAGMDVVVVERADAVGGAARSIEVAGVRCDLGSHRLHRSIDPAILARLRDLLGNDLQVRTRNGRIRLAGRWVPFPLRPTAVAALPPSLALALARDAVLAPLRRDDQSSFDASVRSGLGPTMADRFYGPYARKLWGMEPTAISSEQARRRIGAGTALDLARRVVAGADPEARTFLYPRRGFGQTFEALAAAAVGAGADVRLGTSVTALETGAETGTGGVVVTTAPTAPMGAGAPAGVTSIRARRAWSTIPLPAVARLHRPAPPPEVVAAAGRLRTRAMVLVYLVLDVDRATPHDAHYLPEAWTPVTRVSEPKNYRDGHPGPADPGDPRGVTVLCAEIPCDVGDDVWRADRRTLATIVGDALRRARMPVGDPVHVEVRRLPNAYPTTPIGFEADVEAVDAWVSTRPGLLTFGRQGLFVHDNAHHALAMAWAAGDALRAPDLFDDTAWTAARSRFAEHVVED